MKLLEKEMAKRILALGYDGLGVVVGFYSGLRERWYELRDQEFIRERDIDVTIINTMAAAWLRDKKKMNIEIGAMSQDVYFWRLMELGKDRCYLISTSRADSNLRTYDEALNQAIAAAIDYLESKKRK